jgi:hypothetical protein
MSDSDDSLGDAGGGLPQEPPPHSNGFIEDHNNAGGEGFANGFHAEEDDNGWGADQVAELNYWLDQPDEPDMEEQAQEPHDSDVDMEDPAQESDDSDEERPFGEWTQQEKEYVIYISSILFFPLKFLSILFMRDIYVVVL